MISATSTIDGDALKLTVLHHWRNHGRHDLPWRHTDNPYHILVSEIMLQQTQVPRVIDRYSEFLRVFPSFRVLATATPAAVLKVWQGLGYNRRALMLLRCARAVVDEHASSLPTDREALESLPGIGPYTAGAIMAFAFDAPVAMIETNIRRVYIHHYFPRRRSVPDADILPLVARDVSRVSSAKVWYAALMDYGAWLATQVRNPNTRSTHYTKQSTFEGSRRQMRGAIVRALSEKPRLGAAALAKTAGTPVGQVRPLLVALEREGFLKRCSHARCVHNPHWSLA